ncbi:transaldolase family protein [Acetanaerobacterium elongatum]|uniref:Transaldolase n=1 Tax=Acetanaerobacterium elongatum TaxID=258515 RepID=A0A1H0EET7_9FIRM|nr:transaldolase family protein [Acetanaerobacterium elongatum]SDN81007.1 transaldolase [Acetanaerobacterium elongatum]
MSEFKGKLHETAVKFPDTDIWMDSCGEEELNYGLERGITGATSNPIIVGAVVKNELAYWEPRIKKIIADNPTFSEDDVVWKLIDEVGAERSKKLLPLFEQYKGKKGRLSIQTNAKYYRDTDRMVKQAVHLNSLGRNMQVKMPASAAGIRAMEEATYRGISINATVSFTVAQAVAVAEAVERGLARRRSENLPCDEMSPVCTIMIGRTDDWMKAYTSKTGMVVDPECLEWAGVAVIKEAYRIYRQRGYTTRLLSAANRNHYHWSQLIGGDLCQTINFGWQKLLNGCDVEVASRIDEPVSDKIMKELNKISEFQKSFDEKGMEPEEFEYYGGFRSTLVNFLDGYDSLVKVIRGLMV